MIASKFVCAAICRQPQQFTPVRHRSFRELKKKLDAGLKPFSDEDYAYNDSEKRTGLLKPRHTVEEQIEYMQSKEYFNVYGDRPVWETWIRNLKGQLKMQPPLRLFCIDRNGRFNVNHACPVCRDEYFFFHYQNPKLIEHFLVSGTDIPITNRKTGLCMEQLINLQAEVIRAKEHGTMPFNVEFRHFDYSEWYPGLWKPKKQFNVAELPSRKATVDDIYPNPAIKLTAHKRDYNTHWDEWWVRHAEFARLNKRKLH